MPHTLSSPIAQPNATQWLVSHMHLVNMEGSGSLIIRVDLTLTSAGGAVVASATFDVDDNAQFATDAGNATGSQLVKMRKACYLAAVRQNVIAAGTGA